ncbi:MAG: 50S ribosomal protein L11 methyltransferase [Prevotellaceae bacterium]|jgi:ribosomal protein L11 methyltransferase|nr:50S ribosomal protein L11 methyltransferase [Prevotellaceae bacterium]
MKYLEFTFLTNPCTETVNDVLSAVLADAGFESFVENEGGIKAYIPATAFDATTLDETLQYFPISEASVTYSYTEAEDKDWNEEWEKHFFSPIVIDGRCIVHSSFHIDVPTMEYNIKINPQMAFGTGHHETTGLIISELLNADLTGKAVLDMGCGTSILAILARMRGASPVTAIDIDTWCVNNSYENIALNGFTDIEVLLGDAMSLREHTPFDIIIANINRNILIRDLPLYVAAMKPDADLFLSGFYTEDIPLLRQTAETLGLSYSYHTEKNRWAMLRMKYTIVSK